jgi:glycosyltransferase involved in cell wall biosynthesis
MGTSVHVDLRCLQDPTHPERGIPTYTSQLAQACERENDHLDISWVISSAGPMPRSAVGLLNTGRVVREDELITQRGATVLHTTSPFYDSQTSQRSLDAVYAASVVTLYDLIPLLYPKQYLQSRAARARYGMRLDLVRHADRILSISPATTRDAIAVLGVDPRRVVTIGTGVSEMFVRSDDPRATFDRAKVSLPGLRAGFIMYTGGIDFRKNIDGLFIAFSMLSAGMRRKHQLVIVCQLQPNQREHLMWRARDLGITEEVLLTGYVDDHLLVQLYQTTRLFVFPSLYEGFGLPVAEAMACGAPCIVGDNSSLADIVTEPAARFDASDPTSIARNIVRGVRAGSLRDMLLGMAQEADFRWKGVAAKTLQAYAEAARVAPGRRPVVRSRPRIAMLSPMPPTASGVADYSMRLVPRLAEHVDVDIFCQADAVRTPISGVRWFQYSAFPSVSKTSQGYDEVVYCIGNSHYHLEVFALMRQNLGGTALMHDVNVQGAMRVARDVRPGLLDPGDLDVLHSIDVGVLPTRYAEYPAHRGAEFFDTNNPLPQSLASRVDRILVHSDYAGTLARLDIERRERFKVEKIAFGHRLPVVKSGSISGGAVISLGIVSSAKKSETVIEAFIECARVNPEIIFAVVGENHLDEKTMRRFRQLARRHGVESRVVITGRVTDAEYERWLERSLLAVQLRLVSRGENSAAIADCFTHGVPVIASDLGPVRELSDNAVFRIPNNTSPKGLSAHISALLADKDVLVTMSAAGQRLAEEMSFARAARDVLGTLVAPLNNVGGVAQRPD